MLGDKLPPDNALEELAAMGHQAFVQRQRADRNAKLAARYEMEPGTARLREVRAKMAAAHRASEARLLISADLLELSAIRLERWLAHPEMPRPPLITAVAAMLGTKTAAARLDGRRHAAALVTASDETARAACDLEIVLGEGPSATARNEGTALSAAGIALLDRWPRYGAAVADLGVRAVVAAPLRAGGASIGALCAYDQRPVVADGVTATADRLAAALTVLWLGSR
ncbi:MAG: GAF domain-containing protein [Streptosporangiaceae bacterium]|nr:GAF domain-containing protein [Streptosporangiaceae bacterium]